jgi:gliding motility-associated-like protein
MRSINLYLTVIFCFAFNCLVNASNTDTTLNACSFISQEIGVSNQSGFSYSWLPLTGLSHPDSSISSFNLVNDNNPNFQVIYTLSVNDSSGTLVETHIYRVNVRSSTIFNTLLGSDEICSGDTSIVSRPYYLPITLTPIPAENYAYFASDSTFRFWPTDTTNYLFIITYDEECIFDFITYDVNVKSAIPITLTASDSLFCSSSPDTMQLDFSPAGGIFTGAGMLETGEFISANAGGGYHEIAYQIYQGNCSSSASIYLTVIDDSFVRLDALPNFCQKDTLIELTNGFPLGGSYFIDDVPVSSFNPSLLTQGNHVLTYKFSGDLECEVVKSVIFFIVPLPNKPIITASPSSLVCEGTSVQLSAEFFPNYLWSTGDTTQSITVNQSGMFTVMFVRNIGCSITSDTFYVTMSPQLNVNLTSPLYNSGLEISEFGADDGRVEIVIETGGFAPYTVIFNGDTSQSLVYDQLSPGNYLAYIEDSAGCYTSDSIIIREPPVFEVTTKTVTLPNAFTPNGDGINDFYVISDPSSKFRINTFQVWDVARQLVYSASNYANTWDGKDLNGNRLLTGTYFAVFTSSELNEPVKTFIDLRYE